MRFEEMFEPPAYHWRQPRRAVLAACASRRASQRVDELIRRLRRANAPTKLELVCAPGAGGERTGPRRLGAADRHRRRRGGDRCHRGEAGEPRRRTCHHRSGPGEVGSGGLRWEVQRA